ncbi:TIGR00266 family protein [Candidatus Dojkabacteria bacterium]|nr:TIGR00266 family protein [Candidatus Dojkabacteria bacterium]
MKYEIKGGNLPYIVMKLSKGESVFSEKGGMAWMSPQIKMETNMRGGVMSAIGRAFSGESMFLATFTSEADDAEIAFTSEFPGQIIEFDLSGNSIITQKDAFMVAENTVELSVHLTKRFGMGLLGGEGFILQKLSGKGKAFIEVAGSVEERLLTEGEELLVDTGYIAAYEDSVTADIQMVKGFKNILFGGEGLFLATVKGPGKVWLQSMPIMELAKKIIPYVPRRG